MRTHALSLACAVIAAAACTPRVEPPPAASIRSARQAALTFDQRMMREIIARLQRDEDTVAVWLAYADHVPDWGREISNDVEVDSAARRSACGILPTRLTTGSASRWSR